MKNTALAALTTAVALSAFLFPHGAARADEVVAFTAPQAAMGAKTYAQKCAVCHGANLTGNTGPALAGKSSGIAQQTLVEVYEYVSQQMPMSAPGTLSKAQDVSIVAYLLEKNGRRPGTHPLTPKVADSDTATIEASR